MSKPPGGPPEPQTAPALPEEFAPTGPKLSRFPIQPAPPVRPHLFADEARFALRLALLAGGAELAAWAWVARLLQSPPAAPWLFTLAALRLLRPLWAKAGTRAPRPLVAFLLLGLALVAQGAVFVLPDARLALLAAALAGLPALADLAASCIADSVTVERRAAAFSWLDLGEAAGCIAGLALGAFAPGLVPLGAALALFLAGLGVPDLHDRGTPRSSWPWRSYLEALREPLPLRLVLCAVVGGACSLAALSRGASLGPLLALPVLLAVTARLEPRLRNAAVLPQACAALCGLSLVWPPLALPALGALVAALVGSAARGAAELERPLVSSLAFSGLALGALFAALAPSPW